MLLFWRFSHLGIKLKQPKTKFQKKIFCVVLTYFVTGPKENYNKELQWPSFFRENINIRQLTSNTKSNNSVELYFNFEKMLLQNKSFIYRTKIKTIQSNFIRITLLWLIFNTNHMY